MTILSVLRRLGRLVGGLVRRPVRSARYVSTLVERERADTFCLQWPAETAKHASSIPGNLTPADLQNPLWQYFDAHKEGPGIWKWTHYFDIYHRYLSKFVNTDVHVVEIGIYSGGSLPMWQHYFGPNSHVTGVDIEEACRAYENDRTQIFIGDQADRQFWKRLRDTARPIDVVIDDGGHTSEQQRITLEETLPYIRPGGVYLCEDIHGVDCRFSAFVHTLVDNLNALSRQKRRSHFQDAVLAVHFYPFVVVIEKSDTSVGFFDAPRRGTEWQPFFAAQKK